MGSTICTAGFPSPAIASSCFTARCASIWYGFFIATLLFSAKENCSQPIKRHRAGSRYFLRSTGHSRSDPPVRSHTPSKSCHPLQGQLAASERKSYPAADQHSRGERKSTRLNSSHLVISYAVF